MTLVELFENIRPGEQVIFENYRHHDGSTEFRMSTLDLENHTVECVVSTLMLQFDVAAESIVSNKLFNILSQLRGRSGT